MTVYAHILTTRVDRDYRAMSFDSMSNVVDVWFVIISQSLSNLTADEIKEVVGINNYGIWITTPVHNHFWMITYNSKEFKIQEFTTAEMDNVYTMFEVDEALEGKADINHIHTPQDVEGLELFVKQHNNQISDDMNLFIDELTQAFINNE